MPLSQASFGAGIKAVRARGGDAIASYGGFDADHVGLELADSCTSVDAIAADYERMIRTYGFTRLDLDVEGISLDNAAGIDRQQSHPEGRGLGVHAGRRRHATNRRRGSTAR